MSYEPCLLAFLTRAANALRVGGEVYCCLHPYAREVFHSVVAQLPFRVVDVMTGLNAYHYEGFQESWYRSDYVIQRRQKGPAAFAPHERIPFDDLIKGAHAGAWHGWVRLRANPFRKPEPSKIEECAIAWAARIARPVTTTRSQLGDGFFQLFMILVDGTHLAFSYDRRRAELTYAAYPFGGLQHVMLTTMLTEWCGLNPIDTFRCEVPPTDAPTIRW